MNGPTEKQIEAAARAICIAQGYDPKTLDHVDSYSGLPIWKDKMGTAEAALSAALAVEAGTDEMSTDEFQSEMNNLAIEAVASGLSSAEDFTSDDDALELLKTYGHDEAQNGVIRGDWRSFDAKCRSAVKYLCDEWDFVFEDITALTTSPASSGVEGEAVDAVLQPLEDIQVDIRGLCKWADVATAIGIVRRAMHQPAGRRALSEGDRHD